MPYKCRYKHENQSVCPDWVAQPKPPESASSICEYKAGQKRRGEDLVEGHYTIRCLVVDDLPIHLLIGTHTMDHLAIKCERPIRTTTFGSIHRRVHMEVPFTPWDQVTQHLHHQPVIKPERKALMDTIHRTAHMTN